jgi:hypothetical protein
VNEHTLQEIAQAKDTSTKVIQPTQRDEADLHRAMAGETRPWVPLGLIEVVWAHVVVVDVVDRGTLYPAPQTHMGAPVTNITPANVGQLALACLETMIQKADELSA